MAKHVKLRLYGNKHTGRTQIMEFDKMCERAGVKKEALCNTIFTRQFKQKEGKLNDKERTTKDSI